MLHDGAVRSVGADEEHGVENRQEPMMPVMEGIQQQPELSGTYERSASRKDEEKVCGLAVESGLLEGQDGQPWAGEEIVRRVGQSG